MAPNPRLFVGILERESQWQRLSASAIGVAVTYMLMLIGAIFASGPAALRARPERDDLVVTLLDLPDISELRAAEDPGGTLGDVTGGLEPGSVAFKVSKRDTGRPTPASKLAAVRKDKRVREPKGASPDPATDENGALVKPEQPQPAAAPEGDRNAVPSQLSASDSAKNWGPGPAGALGTGKSGGTSGIAGSGQGLGRGASAGVASGDVTVLPFMDGMTRPELLSRVDPVYTREARDARVAGLILTKCVITTQGRLKACRIVKGIPLMNQAVLAALTQFRYSPVRYQGKPAAVEYVIPIRLVLP